MSGIRAFVSSLLWVVEYGMHRAQTKVTATVGGNHQRFLWLIKCALSGAREIEM